ncbi:hypothetical protein HDC93_000733 [Streptomyces sp. AK010]|nr:hypothetical protein [Streptomyces sp. AK010]
MKLVVQEFLSLDGVSQGPGAPDEDTSDGFERGRTGAGRSGRGTKKGKAAGPRGPLPSPA